MDRPFVWIVMFYAAGVLAGTYISLPHMPAVCLALAVVAAVAAPAVKAPGHRHACICLVLFFLGAVLCLWQDSRNTGLLSLAGRKVTLTGTVCAEPDVRPDAVNYTVRCEEMTEGFGGAGTVRKAEGKIMLSVKNSLPYGLGFGDRVRIAGVPEIPGEPGNPGEFNYREYLQARGIQLIIRSRGGWGVEKTGTGEINPVVDFCLSCKQRLVSVLGQTLSAPHAALMEGILFGTCGRLDPGIRNDFALTGVVHILSVSGYHMGLLVGLCLAAGRVLRLGRFSHGVLTVLVTGFYAVMSGAVPPVIRSLVMAWIMLLARGCRRRYDWASAMSAAALVILLFNPRSLFNAGFQLSFAATWGILRLTPVIVGMCRFLNGACRPWLSLSGTGFLPAKARSLLRFAGQAVAVTVAAQVAVLPIAAYYYGYISLISVLANPLIVPLISLAMLLGGIAAIAGIPVLPLAEAVNAGTGLVLDLALAVARFMAGLPCAAVSVKQPAALEIAGLYAGALLLPVLWRNPEVRLRVRRLWRDNRPRLIPGALLITVVVMWTGLGGPGRGRLEVCFVDIGQGDAILVRSPGGRVMLVDAGGSMDGRGNFDPGAKILLPLLRRQGIGRIDLLVLTHAHADHMQGARALLNDIQVNALAVTPQFCASGEGARLVEQFSGRGGQIIRVRAGENLLLDENITLEVLHPTEAEAAAENNNSLVARLCYGDFHLFLAGDAEIPVLRDLAQVPGKVHAEVIKVPHHGSANGWSREFYQAARPQAAIISVGPNCFGHPAPEVLRGLADFGATVYRTDRAGAVTVRTDGCGYTIQTVKRID